MQRVDMQNPRYDSRTVTIVPPGAQGFVSGDASRWAPWGAGSVKGRLFEVTDPIPLVPMAAISCGGRSCHAYRTKDWRSTRTKRCISSMN
jgi:hypothetical protein